jgi:hypothetical protein
MHGCCTVCCLRQVCLFMCASSTQAGNLYVLQLWAHLLLPVFTLVFSDYTHLAAAAVTFATAVRLVVALSPPYLDTPRLA